MSQKYRAQILLEEQQHAALVEIAKSENRSISDLMREILDDWLKKQDQNKILWEKRAQAMERLNEIRERGAKRYGVYKGNLVEEARAERDADMERVWRGEP